MKKDEILTLRILKKDLDALDDLAKQKGVSRATMARTILSNSRRLFNYLEADIIRKGTDEIEIAEDIARQIQDKLQEELTPDIADTISRIMLNAISQVSESLSQKGGNKKRIK